MTVQARTRIRTATAAEWATDNPILSEGECGGESDTMKLKCGNGVDDWNTLIYVNQAIISTVGLTGAYADLTGKPEVLQSTREPAADVSVAANFSVFADEELVIADGFEVLLETNASLMIL